MVTQRIYLLVLLVAVAMTTLSSIWFLEQVNQRSYAKKTFISPSHFKVNSTKVELPDDFILMTWPADFPLYRYYDLRMRSQLSGSRLRFGAGLMNALGRQRQRCAGETVDSFLISCSGISVDAGSISEMSIDSAYWHVFGNDEVDDARHWYSAAIVLSNKKVLWFEGKQADCRILAESITDALGVDLNWFCSSP